MSRHDYTKHSKKNQNEVNEVEEELEVECVEPSEEVKTEAVAESKPSEESVTENVEVETEVETKTYDLGVVSGCKKLRVRSEPRFGTNVVCEIDQGTRVMIDRSQSTFDYYKIYTESGIEGFCNKSYVV